MSEFGGRHATVFGEDVGSVGCQLAWTQSGQEPHTQRMHAQCAAAQIARGEQPKVAAWRGLTLWRHCQAQFVEAACCEPSCWALRKPDDDGYVVFNAQRLGDDGGRLIGLTFRMDVPESDATRYRGLGEAFGLTNAESKVLARLLDGRMAEEAAVDLGVGIETIRSHIRQIYGKLAVRSREAMFRQVLPFFR